MNSDLPFITTSALGTGQIEASTSPSGIPRAFVCALCPGRGGFEHCFGRVGEFEPDLSLVLV